MCNKNLLPIFATLNKLITYIYPVAGKPKYKVQHFIDVLQAYYAEHGEPPTAPCADLPYSYSMFCTAFRCTSWTDVLKAAGLPDVKLRRTPEVDKAIAHYLEQGMRPSNIARTLGIPPQWIYRERIAKQSYVGRYSRQQLKEAICEMHRLHGRVLTSMFSHRKAIAIRSTFGSFAQALRECGIEPIATRKACIDDLRHYFVTYGKSPAKNSPQLKYEFRTYLRILECRTWNEALAHARIPTIPTKHQMVVDMHKQGLSIDEISASLTMQPQSVRYHLRREQPSTAKPPITPKLLISSLRQYFAVHHVSPPANCPQLPYDYSTYVRELSCKGWTQVLATAKLPTKVISPRHYQMQLLRSQGLSYREIAESLNLSYNSVWSWFKRKEK